MKLTVNGISLHGTVNGWNLLGKSVVRVGSRYSVTEAGAPGRDGVALSMLSRDASTLHLRMITPNERWEDLVSLFSQPTVTVANDDGYSFVGTTIQITAPEQDHNNDKLVATMSVRVPQGCWRGASVTSTLAAAAAVGTNVTLFPGLSAPVQDAIVRVRGAITNPQVADSLGSWWRFTGTVPAGNFLRFELATGRAWLTTTDTWTGGTEVSGLTDFGGPRGLFEITPKLAAGDPKSRNAVLTLTQSSYTAGSGFQVRGRPAYLL